MYKIYNILYIMEKKLEFKKIAADNYKRRNMRDVHPTILCKSFTMNIRNPKTPEITFMYCTTTKAVYNAYKYYPGCNISILNFADGEAIGGGYLKGSDAQEEDLCRKIPELYTSLLYSKHKCYPFGPSTSHRYTNVLFTENMLIKRDEELNFIKNPKKWRKVNVVSAAAPNLKKHELYDDDKMKKLVTNIFLTPCRYKTNNILILGAWGCGAFYNNPETIANLFKNAIEEGLASKYIAIYFAIPGEHNDSSTSNINAYTFHKILNDANLIDYKYRS